VRKDMKFAAICEENLESALDWDPYLRRIGNNRINQASGRYDGVAVGR